MKKQLTIAGQMPYVLVQIGTAKGHFLVDFGSTHSTVDIEGFLDGAVPRPISGHADRFDGFEFYGPWGTVRLLLNSYGRVGGAVRQTGIIGTDFLALNTFTIDYTEGAVYRADSASFCGDAVLRAEGFTPVTTHGFYHADLSQVRNSFPRIPTVPVRIGPAPAIAQLDTGYNDAVHRHSVNVNRAFFQAVTAAGVKLRKIGNEVRLTTCIPNVTEQVIPYRVDSGHAFEIVATDGSAAVSVGDAVILLKDTPPAARVCGGIGTWDTPAAQVAASFFVDAGRVVFDPFRSLVWFSQTSN